MDKRLQLLLELKDKVTAPLRGIQAGSQDAAAALKATREQVREMEKAQRDITGLRTTTVQLRGQQRELQALQGKLAQTNGQLTDARERHKHITASLKTSREAHARMTAALQNGAEVTPAFIGQLEQTRASLFNSQSAYERSKSTLNQYRAQIKNTQGNIQQLSGRINNGQERLQGYKQRLEQAGISTDRLGLRSKELRSRIDQGSASIDRQKQALARLHEQQEKISALKAQHGKAMVHAGMVTALGGGMFAAGRKGVQAGMNPVQEYAQHQDHMLGIARQVEGARSSAGNLTPVYYAIEEQIRGLSQQIPLATTAITDMVTAAARMEVPTDKLAEFTLMSSEMATAFDAVPDEITEAMGKVAKNFKIPTDNIESIRSLADSINYLDDNAISKGGDIISFLNRTSGVISTVAMSEKDAAALGSTLLTLGEREETAATAANAIIQKFAAATKGTKKFQSALKEVGLNSNAVQKGMAKDATDTLMKVVNAIQKLPEDKRIGVMVELVGMEHSDTLAKLVDKPEEFQRQLKLANSTESQGSMAREADARNQTLSAQWQMTQNRAFNLKAAIGSSLEPALVSLMKAVNPLIEGFSAFVMQHKELAKWVLGGLVAISAFTALLGVLLIPLGLIYGKVMLLRFGFGLLGFKLPSLVAGIKGVAAMVARLGPLLVRAAPMLLRILGPIGLLVTAGWMLYSNWDAICGGAKALWQDLGDWWNGFSARMASILSGMWNAVVSTAQGVLTGLVEGVRNLLDGGVGAWMAALLNFSPFGVLWNAITAALSALGIQVPEQFRNFGSFIVDGLIGGIQSKLSALKEAVVGAASSAASWFKERLGIASPSKLFTQYGGWISEGAANGIESGQFKVRAAALAMAGAASVGMPAFAATAELPPGLIDHRPAITLPTFAAAPEMPAVAIDRRPAIAAPAAMRPTVTIQGDNITMHIHSQPGMDAQALAQAISAELQRREYAKAARLQNAFNDFG
ncbi:phage tail tape measure protein [Comamonas sp. NoAH]|uniref:phage tail tape measure protein n=1 Tax=Comamonas halotolerans TaxID=3041496 RepID=UPI0024E0A38A|nr:phage tail tape measure protein [Comamonas sp. NoAH]